MTQPLRADPFRAISDPTRRRILLCLCQGEMRVGDLVATERLDFKVVSQHLQFLRRAKLVSERREGRERRYRIQPEPLREVVDWLEPFTRFWEGKLDALEQHLRGKRP